MADGLIAPRDKPRTLFEEIRQACLAFSDDPSAWQRHRRCPCCGSGPLAFAFQKLDIDHSRCKLCGFVCVDPYPSEALTNTLYAGSYYTSIREYYELPRLQQNGLVTEFSAPRNVLESIVAHASRNLAAGRWLDVGGGIGAFAALAREHLPQWQIELNEMNPRSVEIARNELHLNISDFDIRAPATALAKFDVISAISVLEHVVHPIEFINAYTPLLKVGGLLVLVVPHFTKLNSAVSKASCPNVIPPYHVSLFNVDNLQNLLRRSELLGDICIEQAGTAAFSVLEHVEFWQYWDTLIPTKEDPVPRTIRVKDYPDELSHVLNLLSSVATPEVAEFFADTDGRTYLIAYAVRKR